MNPPRHLEIEHLVLHDVAARDSDRVVAALHARLLEHSVGRTGPLGAHGPERVGREAADVVWSAVAPQHTDPGGAA